MNTVVNEFLSDDGQKKVQVFRRDDGTFGFEALYLSPAPPGRVHMGSWIPYGRFSVCFAATREIAEAEARGRVDWLNARDP